MRDELTINTTLAPLGNSYALPITKREVNLLGIEPGDDLEVRITVCERKHE